jgi:hypothetical protein
MSGELSAQTLACADDISWSVVGLGAPPALQHTLLIDLKLRCLEILMRLP